MGRIHECEATDGGRPITPQPRIVRLTGEDGEPEVAVQFTAVPMGSARSPAEIEEALRKVEEGELRQRLQAVGRVPGRSYEDRQIVREIEGAMGINMLFFGMIRRPGETYEEAARRMTPNELKKYMDQIEEKMNEEQGKISVLTDEEAKKAVLEEAGRERKELEKMAMNAMDDQAKRKKSKK